MLSTTYLKIQVCRHFLESPGPSVSRDLDTVLCPISDVEPEGRSVLLRGPGPPGADSGGCKHVGTAPRDECFLRHDSPGNLSESDVDKILLNVYN